MKLDDLFYKVPKDLKTMVVVFPHDEEVLSAVDSAIKLGIVKAIFVGDKQVICEVAMKHNFNINAIEMFHEQDPMNASLKAVELITNQKADLLMKGLIDTKIVLQAVLNKDIGLRTGRILSHVAVLEVPTMNRLLLLSDGAMNLKPSVMDKKQIIQNAVDVAVALEIVEPKVGLLAAVEKVNEKMEATVDAVQLVNMYRSGEFKNCVVGGPYALDNAISVEAAKHKGMNDPLAGNIDVIVSPYIEVANALYKSMIYFANAKACGVVMGAKAPIVLTSRSDSKETKLYSIALSAILADQKYYE